MTNRRLIRITALALSCITASGCTGLTRYVYNIGVIQRTIKAQGAYVAQDGSVALEGDLIQKGGKAKRYLFKDGESMKQYYRGSGESNRASSDYVAVDPETNRIHLVSTKDVIDVYPTIDDKSNGEIWRMIPSDFRKQSATRDDLPAKFFAGATHYDFDNSIEGFPYKIEGKIIHLRIHDVEGKLGSERSAWYYPAKILLIPAVPLDLALTIVYIPLLFMLEAANGFHMH